MDIEMSNFLAYPILIMFFIGLILQFKRNLNLKSDLDKSNKDASILREEKVNLLNKIKNLDEEHKEIERRFSESNRECFRLKEEIVSNKSERDKLSIELKNIEIKNEGLLQSVSQIKKSADDLEIKLNNSNKVRELSRLRAALVTAARCKLESSVSQIKKQLESVIDEYAEVKKKYEFISSDIDEVAEVIATISDLQGQVTDLKTDKKKLADEYSAGHEVLKALQKEIATLEERLELYSFGLYEPHFAFDASERYKEELSRCYEERKELVKDGQAATCNVKWKINGSQAEGSKQTRHYIKIMLRAFNGECDSAIIKVRWNNVKSMEERIRKSFESINKLGETQKIALNIEYLNLRLKELRLTHEYQEKIHDEREEQRRLREQIREEERSLKEMELAKQEAEKEEVRHEKALEKARQELKYKHGAEKEELQQRIIQLESSLQKAVELKNRAISMAQITKAGYVYIISNIGSFGENVFKIGMTRRLEPSDRVRELSGASVPFSFDIHAMIYSENAPELENSFHRKFKYKRLNLVNGRKEFFNVTLDEISVVAEELNHEIRFTKMAEARDFRETKAIKEKILGLTPDDVMVDIDNSALPEKLFEDLDAVNSLDEDETQEEEVLDNI